MRILQFTGRRNSIAHDWISVARQIADVIAIRRVSELTAEQLPENPYLAEDPGMPDQYQLLTQRRPARLVVPTWGILAERRRAAHEEAAITCLRERHGPIDVLHSHFFRRSRHLPRLSRRF